MAKWRSECSGLLYGARNISFCTPCDPLLTLYCTVSMLYYRIPGGALREQKVQKPVIQTRAIVTEESCLTD